MNISFDNIPSVSTDLLKRHKSSNLYISETLKTTLQETYWSVVFVDGRDHTNSIKTLKYSSWEESFRLISPWTDGCIIYDIPSKKDISLAVPLADCWWIWFHNTSWDLIWIAHAWHLWTSRDIVWEIFTQLPDWEEIKNMTFYLAPMVWKDYEFSLSDYQNNFSEVFKKYSFNPSKYFTRINPEKWYLNLKQMIMDTLLYHWVERKDIEASEIGTNDIKNWYASHRMYTITWDKKFEWRNLFIVSKK